MGDPLKNLKGVANKNLKLTRLKKLFAQLPSMKGVISEKKIIETIL